MFDNESPANTYCRSGTSVVMMNQSFIVPGGDLVAQNAYIPLVYC